MIAVLPIAVLLACVAAAYILMRNHSIRSAAAYDRRTGRRMIEQVVHTLIEEHDDDVPITGEILDEAWAAGNDATAVLGLATPAVQEGAEMALAVYEATIAEAIEARNDEVEIPTLADLLEAVRATPLDPRQPTTTGGPR